MKISSADVCMKAVNVLFQVASDWEVCCDNCKYQENCNRQLRASDFCSDFVFRDDEACSGLYEKFTVALKNGFIGDLVNDRK